MYIGTMPKIWEVTVIAHRDAVHNAILDAATKLIHAGGLTSVNMSDLARAANISRATLYKYFNDLDAVLGAWHRRIVDSHLASLEEVSQRHHDPALRLRAVLHEYAHLRAHQPIGHEAAELHSNPHMNTPSSQLHALFVGLLREAVDASVVTAQLTVDELATYCEHALSAAADLSSSGAVDRLVELVVETLERGARPNRSVSMPRPDEQQLEVAGADIQHRRS